MLCAKALQAGYTNNYYRVMNSAVGEALPQAHAQHQLRRRRTMEQHQQIKDQQLLIEELKKQDA